MRAKRTVMAAALAMAVGVLGFMGFSGCQMMGEQTVVEARAPQTDLPQLVDVGLKQMWQCHLPLQGNERIQDAWRVGQAIYVATTQTRLFRIDKNSGVVLFQVGLSSQPLMIYRPSELRPTEAGDPTSILVVTRGPAFELDIRTGDVIQEKAQPVSCSLTPVVVGNVVLVGGANKFLGLFIDRLGVKKWLQTMEDEDLFLSAPVAVDKGVIFASRSGQLRRVDTDTGDWEWKDRKTNGTVVGGLVADGRAVYVPCMDQRLYAFQLDTGGELWQSQLQGPLDGTPALGGEVVMVPSHGRGLYAVGRQMGDRRWMAPGVNAVATVTGDHVWVGDDQGNLKSLSLATGEVISSTPIPYMKVFVRNPDDDQVVLVNASGAVAGYEPK